MHSFILPAQKRFWLNNVKKLLLGPKYGQKSSQKIASKLTQLNDLPNFLEYFGIKSNYLVLTLDNQVIKSPKKTLKNPTYRNVILKYLIFWLFTKQLKIANYASKGCLNCLASEITWWNWVKILIWWFFVRILMRNQSFETCWAQT